MRTVNQYQQLLREYNRLRKENTHLKQVLAKMMHFGEGTDSERIITNQSTPAKKIRLFQSLFKGRTDVYALRWESASGNSGYTPACAYEWQKPICQKPKIRCSECQNRKLLPLTDEVFYKHLSGKNTIGIYPLREDQTCSFLAIDFDKKQWQQDVQAFVKTCKQLNVPCHIERSRSGNGAHVWTFFASSILASTARKLGVIRQGTIKYLIMFCKHWKKDVPRLF